MSEGISKFAADNEEDANEEVLMLPMTRYAGKCFSATNMTLTNELLFFSQQTPSILIDFHFVSDVLFTHTWGWAKREEILPLVG